MPRRPNRAEQAALALLQEHWDGTLPVPVDQIAKKRGVKIRYEAFEGDLSGALYRVDAGTTVLAVNSWHADVRQRFTIAHEVGHLELHSDALFIDGFLARDGDSSMAIKSEEVEANAFAAELLMPRYAVLAELNAAVDAGNSPTLKRVALQLAHTFDVSEQAMQFRLVNLGLAMSF